MENGSYSGHIAISQQGSQFFARPVVLTLIQRDATGAEQDVGCNYLWVANHDLHRQEIMSRRALAIRTGDQLMGDFLATPAEWTEFAENLWKLIELEVHTASPTRSIADRTGPAGETSVADYADEPETEIILIDATDDDEMDLSAYQIEQSRFEETNLFALIDRVQGLLPNAAQHIGTPDGEIDRPASVRRQVPRDEPPQKPLRRIAQLINRYVRSLENGAYLAQLLPHVILGHYVVFQNLIRLLDERCWVEKQQIVEWLVAINERFFNPLTDMPPLADEQWSRHLSRTRHEAWEMCGAAEYALASLLRLHALLPTLDDSELKMTAYQSTAPTLASLAATVDIHEIGRTNKVALNTILPAACEDSFSRAIAQLIRGARPAILLQLTEWIDQLNLLQGNHSDSYRSRRYNQSRVAYLTAQYELLVKTDQINMLVDLCEELAFWSRTAGQARLSDQWYARLIQLYRHIGLSGEVANILFERAQQQMRNREYAPALTLLEQAYAIVDAMQDTTLATQIEHHIWYAKQNLHGKS